MSWSRAAPAGPIVVLDTNAVLDWLLFQDPCMAGLEWAIRSRSLHWLACARMREELLRTLGYEKLLRWAPNKENLLATFDHWAQMVEDPMPPMPANPRCTDADDQVFIDLAIARQARWLVTKDRALLKLARQLRSAGVAVVRPAEWRPA